jgi:hypothetical protein
MTRRVFVLAALLVFAATHLCAHEKFRIVGTVTKLEAEKLAVKDKNGKVFSIARTKYTTYMRDKKKVSAKDLREGSSVVVEATGDSHEDMVAETVTIVPPISSSTSK